MLVIVLVTLLFTAFAVTMFIEQASTDLLVEARVIAAQRLRRDAYSTLECTLATLEDFRRVGGGLHSPAEGWGNPLAFSGWQPREGVTAEVTLADESGKISLSHVDAATLTNLFKAWDFKQADAEKLTDALLGWMRRDYVSTSALSPTYDVGALPFQSPARAMRTFTELAAIDYAREVFYDEKGRPNDQWRRFVATFSLFNYQQINLNAASADVLAALGFSDVSQHQRLAEYLNGTGQYTTQGPAWLTSTSQAANLMGTPAMPQGVGVQVRALRINVLIREGRTEFRLTAVVAPAGGATTVQANATSTRPAASGTTTSTTSSTPAATAAAKAPAPQLNYPFTLLEITENAEMSATPPVAVPPA
ncbi:MAG: hypothetical protein JWM32_1012 [Verrucomicrobia bacterium]|nr:hypothetical protein [Verrucomicrobiota bacterium]